MPFVIDASVVVAWAFQERQDLAERILATAQTEAMRAPALWWYELRNVLIMGERRGRITEQQITSFLREVSHLAITMDLSPDDTALLTLSRRHRLTVYDAAYLELALREALPLATLDAQLAVAARSETVPLIGD
jgi:predicted nucleic acid-binding protein